ncbi:MAG: putative toxin-antitoxin system toxin component, PIN family [Longimonas sp.]|uniref:putative toxin-antitoxin system toxin component, PIN family n=1 Tax=Longimonas sp. TaxID=2039626 RepID=UPI0039767FBF
MKLVIDTNVLIAAFIARGTCHELLEHCALRHTILISDFILNEFKTKLVSKFGFTAEEAAAATALVRTRAVLHSPEPLSERVCRDRDDDKVLALAVATSANCIVTGDKDLLDLAEYRGLPIVAPGQFWQFDSYMR